MASTNLTQAIRRQFKRSCPDSGASDEDSSDNNSNQHFPRWFVIEGKDLNKLSPFAIGKSLQCQVGTLKTVKRLQRGDILVETNKSEYVHLLLQMTSLANVPVKVSAHRTLNSCKGVIRCRDVARCDKDEILENLKSQGVTDAVVVTLKPETPDGERRMTNTVILSFNRPQPPQYITCGYLRVPVATFVPNPLRCFKCQKFGHGRQHCKAEEEVCARCGENGHDNTNCTEKEHCANCKGDHASFSKACPKWKFEQKVQQIRSEKNVSFIDARKIALGETPSKSMSTIVSSGMRPPTPVSSRSVEVQTDLTWPLGARQPTQVACVTKHQTAAKSTATENVGATTAPDDKGSKGGQSKSTQPPKLNRPPPSSTQPVTDTNRYAALASSQGEEGESSSSVIK